MNYKIWFILLGTLVFSFVSSYAKPEYTAITHDDFGGIWYANAEGLFYIDDLQKSKLISSSITNISALSENKNTLVVGTKDGQLFIFDIQLDNIKAQFKTIDAVSKIIYHNNKFWIATKGNGLFTYQNNTIDHIPHFQQSYIYDITICQNKIVLATDNGIGIIDANCKPYCIKSLVSELPDLLCTSITSNDNKIFIGTQNGNLVEMDVTNYSIKNIAHHINNEVKNLYYSNYKLYYSTADQLIEINLGNNTQKNIFTKEKIIAIFHTHNGNLNIASSLGIDVVKNEMFNYVNTTNPPNIIKAISASQLYYSNKNKLLLYNNSRQSSKIIHQFPSDISCMQCHGKYMWIGTVNNGLYQLDTTNNQIQNIIFNTKTPKSGVLDIAFHADTIYISSLDGIWQSHFIQINFTQNELLKNQNIFYVYQMHFDTKGRMWLATDGQGIFYLHNHILQPLKNKNLDATTFYNIVEDYQHQIWFNSHQKGLYCLLNNDSIVHINNKNGLYSNDVLALSLSKHNYLIATYQEGIQFIETTHFYTSNIQFANEQANLNSISVYQENVWIGTSKGMLQLQLPDYLYNNERQIVIDKIEVNNQLINFDKNSFASNENNFKISYKANLPLNNTIYYRYQLSGQDTKWVNTTDNNINLINVNPGKYNLLIQASNNTDFENAVQTNFSFTIQKPFYLQWWFLSVLALLTFITVRYIIIKRDARKSKIQLLEKEQAIAQYEALKTQVNPHFLFNSLNALMYIIEDDKTKALEYTQKLSAFYRTLISFNKQELISLQQDLEVNDNYMYLQSIRFGAMITYSKNISATDALAWRVPPLTIQMLCENAIKHNIIDAQHSMKIRIFIENNYLIVENTLAKKMSNSSGEGVGLTNISHQFLLHANKEVIISTDNNLFTVQLPKI